ncbi:MAG: hypothetical protein HYZ65_09140 [Burkholderiales bacterium]|nr:hypothetical protein [Burkholderiales bacterium]
MKRLSPARNPQRGAVAVMLVLCLLALVGMMGLALDLSQTYDRKTELQNAADSAALAGAIKLNGKSSGIDAAVANAKAKAALHQFKFNTDVAIPDEAITFSDSPDTADGSWLDISAAKAAPANLLFIKIDTRGGNAAYGQVNTNFIQVLSSALSTTNTYGRAVAGRFATSVTPIGVCAVDPDNQTKAVPHPGLPAELSEWGFRRGLAYDILEINPIGSSADPFLVNPLERASSPSDNRCTPSFNDTPHARPFICEGSSNIVTTLPGYVFANNGMSATLKSELNARFTTSSTCSLAPDANVKQYPPSVAAPASGNGWMSVTGNQGVTLINHVPFYMTIPASNANDWGVLWSYNAAVQFAAPHAAYSTADWPSLYPVTTLPTPTANGNYPVAPDNPYDTSSGAFYQAGSGARDRRVLNILIVDCRTYVKNPSCGTIQVLGIGRFFMPVQAQLPQHLYAEFAGLVPDTALTKEVRLFQ